MVSEELQSTSVVARACMRAGLAWQDATPIRLAENEIWRLPSEHVVVRVPKPGRQKASQREVSISHWLAVHEVPAVFALDQVAQPIDIDGHAVTFWQELPPHTTANIVDVARLLRQLHALDVPDFDIGDIEPFVRVSERIGDAAFLSQDDRDWLLSLLERLTQEWLQLPSGRSRCVVHGDAWVGNCVLGEDGKAYLLDFERTSIGPPEWDLVSTAVRLIQGTISREQYRAYCEAYGVDVTAWSGFETLLSIRELRITSWATEVATRHPQWQKEAQHRVDCLRGHHGPRPWHWQIIKPELQPSTSVVQTSS
ncbi:MAG: aminoglycoside phosphotransferase family protein [Pseudomonadota bacterium]